MILEESEKPNGERVAFEKWCKDNEFYADSYMWLAYQSAHQSREAEVQGLKEDNAKLRMAIKIVDGQHPLAHFQTSQDVNSLDDFAEWVDRMARQYIGMKATCKEEELTDWVEAKAAVFSEVKLNLTRALTPAKESDDA